MWPHTTDFLCLGQCRSILRGGILSLQGRYKCIYQALGKELAPSHIPVNAIACGVIDTDMNRCFDETERAELADEIPAGRFATADEVADMAYSVITAPDYLTGQIITFDGGWI